MNDPPLVVGPVIGLRAWRIVETPEGHRLSGVVHRAQWPAGDELVARCLAGGKVNRAHFSPKGKCQCGIYAATDPATLRAYLSPGAPYVAWKSWVHQQQQPDRMVIGTAKLWGRVVEHAHGYRASHAYPGLIVVSARTANADEIAHSLGAYGVPVEISDAPALGVLSRLLQNGS